MGNEILLSVGFAAIGATLGILVYKALVFHSLKKKQLEVDLENKKRVNAAEIEAARIVEEAEIKARASRKSLEMEKSFFDSEKTTLESKQSELLEAEKHAKAQVAQVAEESKKIDEAKNCYLKRLEELSSKTPEEITEELKKQVERESSEFLASLRNQIEDKGELEIEQQARDLLITAMQRISSNPSTDAAATIVSLPSEDMKGRIIGREGRNIRSFEAVTGTTLMIDETPDTVLISAFDPVKREIAKTTLNALLKDGRIHPSTIETAYEEAKESVLKNVQSLGEKAMLELKLKAADTEVLNILGQLHFRHSFNQNCLDHSIEVAYIASMLASELGLDPQIAKRAALFHDMGKAVDHEYEGSHAIIGGKILRRYQEDPRVINAVEASHEEVPAESVYAPLIIIADKISAMRPGARCDSLDSYVDRVKALESIAKEQKGVRDAFALQAGREVRVIVEPSELNDDEARKLASKITREIEDNLNYPSTIKITVIREQRFCDTAH